MQRKNMWKEYTEIQQKELEELSVRYKECLDIGKTERECVKLGKKMADTWGSCGSVMYRCLIHGDIRIWKIVFLREPL